jgi:hypothetical protein
LTERLAIASRLIKTNYSVYCSDDDFLLPSGLSRAIKILETNNNIVACMGQTFRFDVLNESKLTFGPCYSFNYQLFSINDYDSRLKFAVSKYSPVTCHAVMRTQIWQESWGNIPNFSSSQVLEFFQAFMTHIYGNLLVIKDLYLIRSLENLPLSTPDASRLVTSKIWMDSNKYDQEVNYFIKIISNKIKHLYPQAYNRTEVELLVRNLLHFLIANLSSHRNKKGVFDKFITLFRLKFINTCMRKLVRLFFSNKRKLHYGFVNDLTPGDYGDVTLDQESVIYLKRVELLIFNFYRSFGK